MSRPEGEKNRAVDNAFRIDSRGRSSSVTASCASTPVQCTGTPTSVCSSRTTTSKPSRARQVAAVRPPGPPPTMMTSQFKPDPIICTRSQFGPSMFPTTTERDPERQRHETKIEPEARAPHVEQVETELVRSPDVARSEDLREPREAR